MNPFTGIWVLIVLVVRRDRIRLVLWIGALVALMAVSARSIGSLYDTPATVQGYVETVGDNPALVIFAGPGYGFDDPNQGVILVNETSLWLALGAALMSVFTVVRHTRAEEDDERTDLVRSTVVGRHAPLAAVLAVVATADVLVGIGVAVAAAAFGFPLAGCAALGLTVGSAGVVFAGAAALAAQLAGSARGALGLAAGSVGLAFVVRGIGDLSASALAWSTPFGWAIGVRAFAHERWWVVLGLAGYAAVLCAAAVAVSLRRDLGSGLLVRRGGPAGAGASLSGPLGLVVRLQRMSVLAWVVGMFAAGLVYGSVADDVEDMLADNPQLADFLARAGGASLVDAYLATTLRLLALVACGFAISSALRLRFEEVAGHAEPLLATALARSRWVMAQLVPVTVGSLAIVVAAGVGMGITNAASVHDWSRLPEVVGGALATVPAVLVMAALATALFGWRPHLTMAAWGALAVVAVIDLFAAVLRVPHWVTMLSPISHVPAIPAQPWRVLPIVILSVLAAGLFVIGTIGFGRRDLSPG